MTHDDNELPDGMRAELRGYHAPPELGRADLDAMWAGVEAAAFDKTAGAIQPAASRTRRTWVGVTVQRILPIAAVLLIGVAIGRFSAPTTQPAASETRVASRDSLQLPEPYQSTTSKYLGQTAALLATLPADAQAGQANDDLLVRAQDLLLTTRLLMDSPAAADPRIRVLLDDLELVLAQIARLQTDDGRSELDLIRQALEQRDVLPRLRTAVANISADD